MSCEICGRSSCTKIFHSLESQTEFDNIADSVKERMRKIIAYNVNHIKDVIAVDDKDYVSLEEVIRIIEDY